MLLGGGAVLGPGGCGDSDREACERARRELRPDAEQICARAAASSGHRSSGGSWFLGRSGATARTAPAAGGGSPIATSARGGFGSTAARFGAGS